MRGIRLTPLGRLVVLLTAVLIGAVAGATGASATRPHALSWQCVAVSSGDTLWTIAKQVEPGKDPRRVVDTIVDRNALDGAPIMPGQAIWVPDGPVGPLIEASGCSPP